MDNTPGLCALILAGGRSSRMGRDKALCQLGGKRLIDWSVELASHITNNIIISSNHLSQEDFRYPVIRDEVADIGPLGGIFTAMKLFDFDYFLVLSCDMPFITLSVIYKLISDLREGQVYMAVNNGKIEPLCSVFSRSVLPVMYNQISRSDYAIRNIIRDISVVYVDVTDLIQNTYPPVFQNVNTKNDLDDSEKYIINYKI